MTNDLPQGWQWSTLGQTCSKPQYGWTTKSIPGAGLPYLRTTDISGGDVDWLQVPVCVNEPGKLNDFLLRDGDIVVSRAGTVGVSLLLKDPPRSVFASYLIRLRPHDELSPAFVAYFLRSPQYWTAIADSTIGIAVPNVNAKKLAAIRIPVAPLPEQKRIVAAIEEHFSHLDAVNAWLDAAETRCQALIRSVIVGSIPTALPDNWQLKTVAEAGVTGLGRQRSPKYHNGTNMKPYLRVANVFEDRIDTSSIMEMHFEEADFEKYRLRDGDILLNEGQSPELLGRPAIYRGEPPGVAFTNSLIRFIPGPRVTPEWALLVFRRHMHARRFMRESRITTNIAHLALGRFRTVEFPIPPIDTQHELVASTRAALSSIDQMIIQIQSARARANGIRRAVLAAAFSGELVPQDPNNEPASVLLERITAAQIAKPRRQRVTA